MTTGIHLEAPGVSQIPNRKSLLSALNVGFKTTPFVAPQTDNYIGYLQGLKVVRLILENLENCVFIVENRQEGQLQFGPKLT